MTPRTARNRVVSRRRSIGFCRKKVAPTANARCIVLLSSCPVTITIGVDRFHNDCRMLRARSKPCMSGISRSRKIPSNVSRLIKDAAFWPSLADQTRAFREVRTSSISSELGASSSTTRSLSDNISAQPLNSVSVKTAIELSSPGSSGSQGPAERGIRRPCLRLTCDGGQQVKISPIYFVNFQTFHADSDAYPFQIGPEKHRGAQDARHCSSQSNKKSVGDEGEGVKQWQISRLDAG